MHVIGMESSPRRSTELHPDLTEGDAFLHNDPYLGNTHPADHVILVPVFWEGRHVFTAAAKAHQADCGNAQPTTYMPYARDVYEEGSLIFPAVQVQRDYRDIDDVIRMCRRRIRVPDQWYGDYLAMVGAARIGEARLKELVRQVRRRHARRVRGGVVRLLRAPHGPRDLEDARRHDRRRGDARPVRAGAGRHPDPRLDHDRSRGGDDRGRPDATTSTACPAGVNESRTCALNNCMTGIFNSIDPDIPHNAGTLPAREGEAARELRRRHPALPALVLGGDDERRRAAGRNDPADDRRRLGRLRPRRGRVRRSGPASRSSPGTDWRKDDSAVREPEVPRLAGRARRRRARRLGHLRQRRHERPDVPRQRRDRRAEVPDPHPRDPRPRRLRGAGRRRGAPGTRVTFGPKRDRDDGGLRHRRLPPPAARAPRAAARPRRRSRSRCRADGDEEQLDPIAQVVLEPGELLGHLLSGGGGYGDPRRARARARARRRARALRQRRAGARRLRRRLHRRRARRLARRRRARRRPV